MIFNVGIDNPAVIFWDGTNATDRILTGFNSFGFSIEITGAVNTAAVFRFDYADPSDADPCVPGTFSQVNEVLLCQTPSFSTNPAQLVIPPGLPVGTILAATLPCLPGKFLRITPVSGDTGAVKIVLVFDGPQG